MDSAVLKRVLRSTLLVALFGGGLWMASSSQQAAKPGEAQAAAGSSMTAAQARARATKRNRADPSQHRSPALRQHAEHAAVTYDFFGKPHPKPAGK